MKSRLDNGRTVERNFDADLTSKIEPRARDIGVSSELELPETRMARNVNSCDCAAHFLGPQLLSPHSLADDSMTYSRM